MDTPTPSSFINPLDSQLIKQAEAGNLEAVKLLISQGANINAWNMLHENVLMCAIREKKIEVAIWLIEQGADLVTSNALDFIVIDYISDYHCFKLLQPIIHRQDFDSLHFFNHKKAGQIFHQVVLLGFLDIIDFFIKKHSDWRLIKDAHGREVLFSAIAYANLVKSNKEKKGIYRLLSEMTIEDRQEMLEWQESLSFHTFIFSFEQILQCCDKNVSNLKNEGSLNIFVLNRLLPKDLAAAVIKQWLNIRLSGDQAIPDWYCHRICKPEDAMELEEIIKPPALLFSQESQLAIRKNNTKKKKQDESMDVDNDTVAKHSGCFAFGKPKPKCSIQ